MTITNDPSIDAPSAVDPNDVETAEVEAFIGMLLTHWDGASATVMAAIGDELGLFRHLAAGPATSSELAARAGTDERYTREWLAGMAASRYVLHDPLTSRYELPPAAAAVLATEGQPFSIGGGFESFAGELRILDRVIDAFRRGGGVPQADIHPSFRSGMERMTASWHDGLLVQAWLPAVPGLMERLEAGARVADVGCGNGRAAVRLAEAFPASTVTGFDVFEPSVAVAQDAVAASGLGNVRIELADAGQPLPGRYDLITVFDVVHDAADPTAVLRSIRGALADDGMLLCLEISCGDTLEAEIDRPGSTTCRMISLFYCMTTSLAAGGAGLGTCGVPHGVLEQLATASGFSSVEPVVVTPFNTLYVVRP